MHGVSIICPIKNLIKAGRTLAFQKLVTSYISGRTENSELVIVEGQSSDETFDFAERILSANPNKSISLITCPEIGIYSAINFGVGFSQYDRLMFLGSDDYFLESGILSIQKEIESFDDDFFYWAQAVQDQKGIRVEKPKPASRIIFGNFFCFQSFLIKKSTFLNMNGFNRSFSLCADYDLALRLILSRSSGRELPLVATVVDRNGESSNREVVISEISRSLTENIANLISLTPDESATARKFGRLQNSTLIKLILCAPNSIIRRSALWGLAKNLENTLKRWS